MLTLGVSIILFYGGLNLSVAVLRQVWVGLGLLMVAGVILTTLVVGAAAYLVYDLPWSAALLVGAILSPTDPAILIPLFASSRVRPEVAQTVVAESAFNDPTGAALALALAGIVLTGENSISGPASEFVVDLAISTMIGVVAGVLLAAAHLEPPLGDLARELDHRGSTPRSVEEGRIRPWQVYGRGIDAAARALGQPAINKWLRENPDAARAAAQGE